MWLLCAKYQNEANVWSFKNWQKYYHYLSQQFLLWLPESRCIDSFEDLARPVQRVDRASLHIPDRWYFPLAFQRAYLSGVFGMTIFGLLRISCYRLYLMSYKDFWMWESAQCSVRPDKNSGKCWFSQKIRSFNFEKKYWILFSKQKL